MNDIEILEEFIKYFEAEATQRKYRRNISITVGEDDIEAIENLIQRNKELEEENIKYPIKMNNEQYNKTINNAQKELKQELERQINAREITEKYIDKNFIETSKIKEKIERLKILAEKSDDETLIFCELDIRKNQIYLLQSLLGDDN